ncbi:hypothetical protein RV045_11995 [Comamonadaceae bacterium SL12-8]|uniref:Uncharacterized protein n=1 Tax=Amphibiibacter pelophylacis TaxID=1799477 RepID=A0ACC6P4J9_9BURK
MDIQKKTRRSPGFGHHGHSGLLVNKEWIKIDPARPLDGIKPYFGLGKNRWITQAAKNTKIEVRLQIQLASIAIGKPDSQTVVIKCLNVNQSGRQHKKSFPGLRPAAAP